MWLEIFEFIIFIESKNFKQILIRFKIYDKTAELLTSLGVSYDTIADPFSRLVLTNNYAKNRYRRQLFNYKEFAACRLEVSFYGSNLK